MNEENNFVYWLGIISNILQVESYNLLLKDKTNNELMKELQNQDQNYLEKIVKQNEEIIAMLKKMWYFYKELVLLVNKLRIFIL